MKFIFKASMEFEAEDIHDAFTLLSRYFDGLGKEHKGSGFTFRGGMTLDSANYDDDDRASMEQMELEFQDIQTGHSR